MNLKFNNNDNYEYDFISFLLTKLKEKGLYEVNISLLKNILRLYKTYNEYDDLFKKINQFQSFEEIIKILAITGIVYISENNIYIIGNYEKKPFDEKLSVKINNIINKYIEFIENNIVNIDIRIIDPNTISYKTVNGFHENKSLSWNLITDGNIRLMSDINSKKYCNDIINDNVILLLTNSEIKKIMLKDSKFAISEGKLKDEILKKIIYAKSLNKEEFEKLNDCILNRNVSNVKYFH